MQGAQSQYYGGPFAVINGALAEDVICVYVPKAVELERPIHAIFATSGDSWPPQGRHLHNECTYILKMLDVRKTSLKSP